MNRTNLTSANFLTLCSDHLSEATKDWLENTRSGQELAMMSGVGGDLFFDTENVLAVSEDDEIPEDFLLLINFAHENKFSNLHISHYVPALDILPVYEKEGNNLVSVGTIANRLGVEKTKYLHPGCGEPLVDAVSIERDQMAIPAGTTSLEDGDYEADAGAVWIGVGDASVRVELNENCVTADIYARGCEDSEPLGSALADNGDLRNAIDDAEPPEPM